MKVIVSFVALVLLAACGGTGGTAADGSGGTSSTTAKAYTVGTAMTSDSHSVTVTAFKRNYSSGNMFEKPAKGKECVRVSYALKNSSSNEWSDPLFEIAVVDANGQKYNASFTCGPNGDVSSLVAGGHASTTQLYEVTKGVALDVAWSPNLFDSSVLQTPLK